MKFLKRFQKIKPSARLQSVIMPVGVSVADIEELLEQIHGAANYGHLGSPDHDCWTEFTIPTHFGRSVTVRITLNEPS